MGASRGDIFLRFPLSNRQTGKRRRDGWRGVGYFVFLFPPFHLDHKYTPFLFVLLYSRRRQIFFFHLKLNFSSRVRSYYYHYCYSNSDIGTALSSATTTCVHWLTGPENFHHCCRQICTADVSHLIFNPLLSSCYFIIFNFSSIIFTSMLIAEERIQLIFNINFAFICDNLQQSQR
ncbi:hypothetical protein D917_00871 [Trichinella nativa]|uniref:Uncharacterized protein n=1 Tax=Trichinella nativa TaxID=6335 RepID=A0A1Y3E723_9BILA|nr:hypothetical protein D917_00871 [Trichinella nativa]